MNKHSELSIQTNDINNSWRDGTDLGSVKYNRALEKTDPQQTPYLYSAR